MWEQGGKTAINQTDLTLKLTILLYLLNNSNYWYVKIPVTIVCLLALLFSRYLYTKPLWLGLALVMTVGNIPHYFEIDNHKFLFIYWCLAIFICLYSDNFEYYLRQNAKWLIGLVFFFACLWKSMSNDYLDGSFFVYSLLTDDRFIQFLLALNVIPKEVVEFNQSSLRYLVNDSPPPHQANLQFTYGIKQLAYFFTYWGLLLEGLIAVAFLLPLKTLFGRYRDYTLALFLVSTYLIAPVWGFGCILSIMGLSQSTEKKFKVFYICLFFLMQVYRIPIFQLLQ